MTTKIVGAARVGAGLTAALLLAGCSSIGSSVGNAVGGAGNMFGNLLAFHSPSAPPLDKATGLPKVVGCPEISVDDGAGALRVYAGADHSSDGVRYQIDIADYARQCDPQNNQLGIKVGVRGRFILGPAGAPGDYFAPVRIAIKRQSDDSVVTEKVYRTAVAPQGGETTFETISDPMFVPIMSDHADQDYTIAIGLDQSADQPPKPAKKRRVGAKG
jgi:hypothetical protein